MFTPVMIYSMDAEFIGYAVMAQSKLQSTNVYLAGEEAKLNERIAALNTDIDLRAFWPHPQDPEVVALLNDPTFFPIEYMEIDMVDDENSYYAWIQVEEVDNLGNPTGRMVDSEVIDEEASVLSYKRGMAPIRPTDQLVRIKNASETIARKRAGLDG